MKLNLNRPIVFFDLETTGIDIVNDRIVEICLLKVFPNGNEESKVMRINPTVHIPEEASAVHGIFDEDVANCPTFKDVAADVWDFFKGCDIGGFNSNRFDIPMLVEEFLRAGINADLHHCLCIDGEALEAAGWKVITLWECDIKKRFNETMETVVWELNESIKK